MSPIAIPAACSREILSRVSIFRKPLPARGLLISFKRDQDTNVIEIVTSNFERVCREKFFDGSV